ncbi:hypothetical protein NO935_23325 (plasmid) [Xanthomonas oryzae pv. oryzae]|nr:hypothetical protein NO935_23325 [Xanthomonas oryzae pv. oryzae]
MNKEKLLAILRKEATLYLKSILDKNGTTIDSVKQDLPLSKRKKIARTINTYIGKGLYSHYLPLCKTIADKLLLAYCLDIVMLEHRQKVWSYEYMTFARRIGELWEPFCKIPINNSQKPEVSIYTPISFNDVKESMREKSRNYFSTLPITSIQKKHLYTLYDEVWSFIDSEAINLSLDQHVKLKSNGQNIYYDIDYKSGFSSNEKGNTNRLLQVASIYKSLPDDHRPLLFVRQPEAENNHYAKRLKDSGLWKAYFGADTYKKIEELSGFPLRQWMGKHMDWANDITDEFHNYLLSGTDKDLMDKYLSW